MNRRQFLKAVSVAAAGAAAGCASSSSTDARSNARIGKPLGANGDIRLGVIGFNAQGKQHIKAFRNIPGVRIVALCDADEKVLNATADALAKEDINAQRYRDMRDLLDNKDIDAVSMALPIRWHSLAGVWAVQAGKHAYVEKPVSHCIWEGRKLVEASRRHRRLVQAGLNNRSRPELGEIFAFCRSGAIGRIDHVRAWDYKRRPSIGRVSGPQRIPEHVDYNLWVGPGPMLPLMRAKFHYDWHWQWAMGCGEIANNGVHQFDKVRWALDKRLPRTVVSFGGRYGYVDDGQTPNTHVAVYDFDGIPLIYEARGLASTSSSDRMDDLIGTTASGKPLRVEGGKGAFVGIAVICEGGYAVDSTVYDNDGKVIRQLPRQPVRPHAAFIDALRSGKREDLRPDIEEGHLSTALCHMGNASINCGEPVTFTKAAAALEANPHAAAALQRMVQHLNSNAVDTARTTLTLGPKLTMDARQERFTAANSERANWFLKDSYRAPFVVPERV